MRLEDNIKTSILNWLVADGHDAKKVLRWEEYEYAEGYCETCYYEEARVRVEYVDSHGETKTHSYWSNFADLIQTLSGY